MLSLAQKGTGARRPLVYAFFVAGPATASLLAALGPEACVVTDCDNPGGRFCRPPGAGGVDKIGTVATWARMKCGEPFEPSSLILIGWSAGCEAVRELLRAGAQPDAVIALDGVSGSHPTPTEAQIAPWRELGVKASEELCLFMLTHTAMGYVERLPAGQDYESTTHMAAIVTGTAGETPPSSGPIAPVAGSLYVLAYPSKDIDGGAHIRQVREVLPDVARRILVPWLAARAGDPAIDSDPAPVSPPPPPRALHLGDQGPAVRALQAALNAAGASPTLTPDGSFGPKTRAAVAYLQLASGLPQTGEADAAVLDVLGGRVSAPASPPGGLAAAVLEVARADLAAGIREAAHNDGPELRRLYGNPPGENWCARAFTSWLRRGAAALRVQPPIAGGAGTKALITQFQAAGRWTAARDLKPQDIVAGVVPIWDRSQPGKPETSWWGHIGLGTGPCVGGHFLVVAGNSGPVGDRVFEGPQHFNDPRLLGVGRLG